MYVCMYVCMYVRMHVRTSWSVGVHFNCVRALCELRAVIVDVSYEYSDRAEVEVAAVLCSQHEINSLSLSTIKHMTIPRLWIETPSILNAS